MKVIVIGATGTIGAAVATALEAKHDVIRCSRSSTPSVDIEDIGSIRTLFDTVSEIDAVVCCAGSGRFKPLPELTDEDIAATLRSKLMGQVNLTRIAVRHLRSGGSVTLTSGVLAQRPMPGSAAISLVNAGLEGFMRAAAIEAGRGIRVNVVSPPWVSETLVQLKMDPAIGIPASGVAKAYVAAVEGQHQGETLEPAQFV
jgi:NAD(P)-dependent dehydrogenase (short-subunit alcohol dehydrogenase family)